MREHMLIRAVYFLVLTGVVALLVWAGWVLFVPLLAGFLVAFLATPFVDAMDRRGIKRGSSAALLFLACILILGGAVYVIMPAAQDQYQQIVLHQEDYRLQIEDKVTQLRNTALRHLSPETVQDLEHKARVAVSGKIDQSLQTASAGLAALAHHASTFLFVPIIAFFFLVQGREIKKYLVSLLPNRYFEMTLMLMHQVNSQLGGYLRGQITDCVINGLIYTIGLSLLQVKGAVAIGIFAGIANAVPYVGPILGAIPGMAVLLVDPMAQFPWWTVAVLFFLTHMVDNVVIYPATVGRSLHLPPFVVILGILFGGTVAGIPGMIVTVPLVGMLRQTFVVLHSSLKSYRII